MEPKRNTMNVWRLTGIFIGIWILFILLSPGLFIALPPVGQVEHKQGMRPIRHSPVLMGGHTNAITSAVHALIFGTCVGAMLAGCTRAMWSHGLVCGLVAAAMFYIWTPGNILSIIPTPVKRRVHRHIVREETSIFFSGVASPLSSLLQGVVATALIFWIASKILGDHYWQNLKGTKGNT